MQVPLAIVAMNPNYRNLSMKNGMPSLPKCATNRRTC